MGRTCFPRSRTLPHVMQISASSLCADSRFSCLFDWLKSHRDIKKGHWALSTDYRLASLIVAEMAHRLAPSSREVRLLELLSFLQTTDLQSQIIASQTERMDLHLSRAQTRILVHVTCLPLTIIQQNSSILQPEPDILFPTSTPYRFHRHLWSPQFHLSTDSIPNLSIEHSINLNDLTSLKEMAVICPGKEPPKIQ